MNHDHLLDRISIKRKPKEKNRSVVKFASGMIHTAKTGLMKLNLHSPESGSKNLKVMTSKLKFPFLAILRDIEHVWLTVHRLQHAGDF